MIMELGNPLLMEWIPGDLESYKCLTWDPNQTPHVRRGFSLKWKSNKKGRKPAYPMNAHNLKLRPSKDCLPVSEKPPLKSNSTILHKQHAWNFWTCTHAQKQNCGRLDPPQKVTKYITTLCDFGDLGILGDSQLLGIQRKLNPCVSQGSFSWVIWHQLKHQLKKSKPFKLIIDVCQVWSTQQQKMSIEWPPAETYTVDSQKILHLEFLESIKPMEFQNPAILQESPTYIWLQDPYSTKQKPRNCATLARRVGPAASLKKSDRQKPWGDQL